MQTIHTQIAKLKPRNAWFSAKSRNFILQDFPAIVGPRFELGPFPLSPAAFLLSNDYHRSQFSDRVEILYHVHIYWTDLFCISLQLKKALLGPKRFANQSYLPRVFRPKTD